ncbi:hypothetical protein Scep_019043 [Stephania cephalantha]|uniref:Uncharacterized protein n=1 Tax=Stephania cephalantha TaxID=152367 RepID=A0AAP0IA45_9MAGN
MAFTLKVEMWDQMLGVGKNSSSSRKTSMSGSRGVWGLNLINHFVVHDVDDHVEDEVDTRDDTTMAPPPNARKPWEDVCCDIGWFVF